MLIDSLVLKMLLQNRVTALANIKTQNLESLKVNRYTFKGGNSAIHDFHFASLLMGVKILASLLMGVNS